MNQDREEDRIRQHFSVLKREDERIASSFTRTWNAARARQEAAPLFRRYARIATASLVPLALLAVLLVSRQVSHHEEQGPQHFAQTITDWESVTDSLLDLPGERLLTTFPQLEYSDFETGLYPFDQKPQNNGSAS